MRKYKLGGTEYIVNSQYTKKYSLNELLEEIALDRYRKSVGKNCSL